MIAGGKNRYGATQYSHADCRKSLILYQIPLAAEQTSASLLEMTSIFVR